MQITNVKVNLIKKGDKLKAVAEVIFDHCFVVKDIKVIETKEGLMVGMPSKKVNFGGSVRFFDIVHPIAPGFRKDLDEEILKAYNEKIKETEKPKVKKEEQETEETKEETETKED